MACDEVYVNAITNGQSCAAFYLFYSAIDIDTIYLDVPRY